MNGIPNDDARACCEDQDAIARFPLFSLGATTCYNKCVSPLRNSPTQWGDEGAQMSWKLPGGLQKRPDEAAAVDRGAEDGIHVDPDGEMDRRGDVN
jgi:hypothetical protein